MYGACSVDMGNEECMQNCRDGLCGLVVSIHGCRMELYCVSCEVQTEFIYVM
jgi:hypothetical protein